MSEPQETGTERCKWCGEQLGGIKSSHFDEVCDDCGIRQPWERAEDETVAIIGCGANKIVTSSPIQIRDLYTSDYFRQKRELAEKEAIEWRILSAKHGLVFPLKRAQTYDGRPSQHTEEQREEWLDDVEHGLRFLAKRITPDGEILVLAGRDYVEPIQPILDTVPRTVRDPFASTRGIGEQRSWLADELAETEQVTLGEVA